METGSNLNNVSANNGTRKKSLVRKWVERLVVPLALAYIVTATPTFVNDNLNERNPSKLRTEFKQVTGSNLLGWKGDIEEYPGRVFEVAESLYQLKRENPSLKVNSIRVIPKNIFKRTLIQHLAAALAIDGLSDPSKASIQLSAAAPYALDHEVGHIVFEGIEARNSEIKERFLDLSKDSSGKSLYLSFFDSLTSRLAKHNPKKLEDVEDFLRSGIKDPDALPFVDGYSRKDYEEDFCQLFALTRKSWINYPVSKSLVGNNRLTAKLDVMREHGAISADFIDFLKLLEISASLKEESDYLTRGQEFLSTSKRFLEEHPSSRNSSWVHFLRGRTIGTIKAGKFEYSTFVPEKVEEFMKGLAEYSETTPHLLRALSYANFRHDLAQAKNCRELAFEYVNRRKQGDLSLLLEKPSERIEARANKH